MYVYHQAWTQDRSTFYWQQGISEDHCMGCIQIFNIQNHLMFKDKEFAHKPTAQNNLFMLPLSSIKSCTKHESYLKSISVHWHLNNPVLAVGLWSIPTIKLAWGVCMKVLARWSRCIGDSYKGSQPQCTWVCEWELASCTPLIAACPMHTIRSGTNTYYTHSA